MTVLVKKLFLKAKACTFIFCITSSNTRLSSTLDEILDENFADHRFYFDIVETFAMIGFYQESMSAVG